MERFPELVQGFFLDPEDLICVQSLFQHLSLCKSQSHKILGEVSPCWEGPGLTFPRVPGERGQGEVQILGTTLGLFPLNSQYDPSPRTSTKTGIQLIPTWKSLAAREAGPSTC